jgi:hypothetical protein
VAEPLQIPGLVDRVYGRGQVVDVAWSAEQPVDTIDNRFRDGAYSRSDDWTPVLQRDQRILRGGAGSVRQHQGICGGEEPRHIVD